MKILLAHNYYRNAGGEDAVVAAERQLLKDRGHSVVFYARRNDTIALNGIASRLRLAAGTVWARDSYRTIHDLIRQERPDVAHFHNTMPLISPSAYYACQKAGVPVVQTLHNYRLLCPAATLYRAGRICTECVKRSLLRGIQHGCYRGARGPTAAVAAMLGLHRGLGTWTHRVDCYVALSEFARDTFVQAGLPREKVVVKPNFVYPDPGTRETPGDYVVFVGRLSEEKGLRTLLAGWQRFKTRIQVRIVGDGPLRRVLERQNADNSILFCGSLSRTQVMESVKGARFLLFPSEWYEGFPMVLAESFACGVPVIASRLGAMEEIVEDGRTGLHFTPRDPYDLAAKVRWAWDHPQQMVEMGRNARREYERKYTASRNYEMLLAIYHRVLNKPFEVRVLPPRVSLRREVR